jgi:nicotinamidase-related amidase
MGFRSRERLDRRVCAVLMIDLQEKLLPAIPNREDLLAECTLLVRGAAIWSVPVTVTEQYPQGLGPTVAALRELLPPPREKLTMSAAECLRWPPASESDRPQVVLAGIETHVCVLQTALDLLAGGYQVFVAVDAVGSRFALDRSVALDRLARSGVNLTTVEAVLFEWAEAAGSPEFKQTSQLVKARSAEKLGRGV